ncbi:MAG: 1-acyl-sn-glycerol-3-phosphate acyltransferase [Anaerolineales bacterium]|nr:1-acyl-sn-glycerol-3-phosphate acyltransferase [Anaerolineales bacterium]
MKRFVTLVLRFLISIIAKTEISGLENIPLDRPVVLCGNHIGILDGPFIPTIPVVRDHPNQIVVVAEKYQESGILGWGADKLGFLFIDRYNPDVKTLKIVLRRLEKNGLLVIAPEGTRSPNASLIEGKSGAAYLAAKTGATIIPFGSTGTEDHFLKTKLKKFKRLQVKINIGKPFTIPELPKAGKEREDFLRTYTDEIMCQIAALLPESYRGIYAHHPRLYEILGT